MSEFSVSHLRTPEAPNVVTCVRGRPWNPVELANFWDKGVADGTTVTFSVEHYRAEDHMTGDLPKAWLLQIESRRLNNHVVVFHADVDPVSKMCPTCGTQVGRRGA